MVVPGLAGKAGEIASSLNDWLALMGRKIMFWKVVSSINCVCVGATISSLCLTHNGHWPYTLSVVLLINSFDLFTRRD